ncbi:hypothetical protein CCP3SC1AL1_110036 [Gammaproteobacteria bacterium]
MGYTRRGIGVTRKGADKFIRRDTADVMNIESGAVYIHN